MTESQTFPPYEQGHFDVSNGHRLYYERYGRSGGLPVLFVHGGPGAGFSEDDKAFFDPNLFDVLLFEQRGSGRSKPFASLESNHPDALVDYILDNASVLDGIPTSIVHGRYDVICLAQDAYSSCVPVTRPARKPSRNRRMRDLMSGSRMKGRLTVLIRR